jgi:hypothetical protein
MEAMYAKKFSPAVAVRTLMRSAAVGLNCFGESWSRSDHTNIHRQILNYGKALPPL